MNISSPPGIGRELFHHWLNYVGEKHFHGTHISLEGEWWLSDMRYLYYSVMYPLRKTGILGLGYTYMSIGGIIATDVYCNKIGLWTAYDYAIALAYGKEICKGLGLGASLKYIYSFIGPSDIGWSILYKEGSYTAKTVAFDIGAFISYLCQGSPWDSVFKI
ncbi:MAG: hypothetical protein QMD71_05380 [bacterium]|nr:hypothetical protein [bacterium]